MTENLVIRFQGNEYLLIGGNLDEGGPIATRYEWESGELNYAALCEDGKVRRFMEVIGTVDEIEVLGREESTADPMEQLGGLLDAESWMRR